ncbi:ATP-dependent zinc metalloprotease FtsH [Candidatus Gromoviella agglomerans]|uniref:ATP-dependent zinc metalloprotease FtsH n=1 Tax=Candidatus Gromoviella agglomerans TaxID=2806609 RepID=UPI001E5CB8D4|nr:ATP-dependent zinc metalloprotease FtsH [Candidatus Gromoviella agglomerans]UFX98361.1 ATP-dependent zinc metalloprotease FtsH [Candidatus Gromoviella agglomerans]
MKKIVRNVLLWVSIFLISFWSVNLFLEEQSNEAPAQIALSDFVRELDSGKISDVYIHGYKIKGQFADGRVFLTYIHPQYAGFINQVMKSSARVRILPVDEGSWSILGMMLSWLPMILFFVAWLFIMRKMQGGGRDFRLINTKSAQVKSGDNSITLEDVAGIDEVKEEVLEIIKFMKEPAEFKAMGAKIPKGLLLSGPPGVGKTLLARAIASETNSYFAFYSGSEFTEMFVGVGASRVREMFNNAKKHSPAIIFIDEIDAIGRRRGMGIGGGHDEKDNTLNQLLVEIDGFFQHDSVLVIAATNMFDLLDPALLRPGRFDRKIVINYPDKNGREKILQAHLKRIRISDDLNVSSIADITVGWSGADLAYLLNEAAINACMKKQESVSMENIDYARSKIIMGNERKSMNISDEEKKIIAFHESGHTILAYHLYEKFAVKKVTIMPTLNGALGYSESAPIEDYWLYSQDDYLSQIVVALGGRSAEFIKFGKFTSGAQSDLRHATNIAVKMVTCNGMGGSISYVDRNYRDGEISDYLKDKIDKDVEAILNRAQKIADKLLNDNMDKLNVMSEALLESETLYIEKIQQILGEKMSYNLDSIEFNK